MLFSAQFNFHLCRQSGMDRGHCHPLQSFPGLINSSNVGVKSEYEIQPLFHPKVKSQKSSNIQIALPGNYIEWIVRNSEKLPPDIVFLHGHTKAWHQDHIVPVLFNARKMVVGLRN